MSLQWGGIDRMRSGPLFELAARTSRATRRRAYEWLRDQAGGFRGKVVLDHGSTPDTTSADSNCHIPWLLEDGATVYCTSAEEIGHLARVFPGVRVVAWPPQEHFGAVADLVISSSVIAHVGDEPAQLAFVEQLLALGKQVYLTTPNRGHWLEFHTKLPLLHWLPNERYHALLRRLGLGFWAHLYLLTHDRLLALFERAADARGTGIDTRWYEPRLLGVVSNLVVLATPCERRADANPQLEDEARVFARYAIGQDADTATRALYARAAAALGLDRRDALVAYALRNRWAIGMLDGALALTEPDALLRKKLVLVAAILETQPRYADAFLPRDRSPLDWIGVAAAAARGAIQTLAGLVLLRAARE